MSHYNTVDRNFLKFRCKKVFLRLGIGTNIIQRLSFIAAFPFMCLAFHTKHSKHEKSYNPVTTKWLQLNILGAERRKWGAPSLCRHAREAPFCKGGVCGSPTGAIQLPTWEARAGLAISQGEGALLVPRFVQPLRQGEHKG